MAILQQHSRECNCYDKKYPQPVALIDEFCYNDREIINQEGYYGEGSAQGYGTDIAV